MNARARFYLVSVLALSVASCSKEQAKDAEPAAEAASAAKPAAAASIAPAPAPVAEMPTEKMSCAGEAKAENECAKSEKGCNQWDEAAATVLARGVPADADWHTYKVTGMTCGGCERRVIAKLGEIDGVVGVEADAELGQVRFATAKKSPAAVETAKQALDGLYKIDTQI